MPLDFGLYAEAPPLRVMTGKVVAPVPTSDAQALYVRCDSSGQSQSFGPCVWAQKGHTVPVAGTLCLVALDENGNAWVIGWVGATS